MRLRVLIVDDEPQVRQVVALLLQDQGHETVCASSGAEGLQFVHGSHFDVAILDLRMPGLSGIEVWQQMCASEHHPPGILMTAAADGADLAAEHGLCFLPKPLTATLLDAALRAAVKGHGDGHAR